LAGPLASRAGHEARHAHAASGFCPGGEHAECFVAIDSPEWWHAGTHDENLAARHANRLGESTGSKAARDRAGEIHCDGGFWDGGGRNGFCRRLIRAYIDEFHGNKDDEASKDTNADPKKDDPKNGEPKNAEPKRTMPRTTATGKTRNPAGPCRPVRLAALSTAEYQGFRSSACPAAIPSIR